MECFSVKISGFNQGIAEEEALIKQLKNVKADIEGIKSRVDFQVKGRAGVMNSFNNINAELEGHISVWGNMKDALGNVSNLYQAAEKKNAVVDGGSFSATEGIGSSVEGSGAGGGGFSGGGGGGGGGSIWSSENEDFGRVGAGLTGNGISFGFGTAALGSLQISESGVVFQKGSISAGLGAVLDFLGKDAALDGPKYKHKIYEAKQTKKGTKGEFTNKDGEWIIESEKYGSKDKKEGTNEKKETKTKEETDKEKRKEILENITIASWKKDFISAAIWKGSFENENVSGNLAVSELKVDGKASLTAAGAEIGLGLSYTLLGGDIEGKIGDENFGAHASGDFAIGKAEAKAKVKASILDEKGNLDLNLGAKASAEAIALEANVAAGVNLAGADVSVTGGVTVGVGAHADVGFYNGKIKFDVGASMGIGLSVDLEIDLSKPLEKLGEVAKGAANLWNQFTGWFR